MKQYAVIDIGSNTVVLVLYHLENGLPVMDEKYSDPVHLVRYNHDGVMEEKGISLLHEAVSRYMNYVNAKGITDVIAEITEPHRGVINKDELIQAVVSAGVTPVCLTGREEAECDFLGTSIDRKDQSGIMVDIGGGSTELVTFKDGKIVEAVSIPLGCVRLSLRENPQEASRLLLEKTREEYPLLENAEVCLAVGGTFRAALKVAKGYYGTKHITSGHMQDLQKRILAGDEGVMKTVREHVSRDRQPYLVPGMAMILEVIDSFGIKEFHRSHGGVREGFLLKHLSEE